MGLTLTRRPEFVDQVTDRTFPHLDRSLTELTEVLDQIIERPAGAIGYGLRDGGNSLEQGENIKCRIGSYRILADAPNFRQPGSIAAVIGSRRMFASHPTRS